jgi:hypothetical protein
MTRWEADRELGEVSNGLSKGTIKKAEQKRFRKRRKW